MVVDDAGGDSAANQAVIEASGVQFVGSLIPSDHPDLLAVGRPRYLVVDPERFPGLSAFQTRTHALGADRRVIVTHCESFHQAQARGFEQTPTTARRRLGALQARRARGKTRASSHPEKRCTPLIPTSDRWAEELQGPAGGLLDLVGRQRRSVTDDVGELGQGGHLDAVDRPLDPGQRAAVGAQQRPHGDQ
jgi:hypothetical protein